MNQSSEGRASLVQVVTLAVYLLDGHVRPVDTEDVAMKANQLAPGRFAWSKYPDQVNLELVRVRLSEAKSEPSGRMVAGAGKEGWTLTREGLEWARGPGQALLSQDMRGERHTRRGGSVDEARWLRERRRLVASDAWGKWQSGARDNISGREAAAVFRIDTYGVGRTRVLKIARVREAFDSDSELGPFVEAMAEMLEASPTEED